MLVFTTQSAFVSVPSPFPCGNSSQFRCFFFNDNDHWPLTILVTCRCVTPRSSARGRMHTWFRWWFCWNSAQLKVYPNTHTVLCIPGGCAGFLNHQQLLEHLAVFHGRLTPVPCRKSKPKPLTLKNYSANQNGSAAQLKGILLNWVKHGIKDVQQQNSHTVFCHDIVFFKDVFYSKGTFVARFCSFNLSLFFFWGEIKKISFLHTFLHCTNTQWFLPSHGESCFLVITFHPTEHPHWFHESYMVWGVLGLDFGTFWCSWRCRVQLAVDEKRTQQPLI